MDAFSVIIALGLFITALARSRSWVPVVTLVVSILLLIGLGALLAAGNISQGFFLFMYQLIGTSFELVFMWAIFNPDTFRGFFHNERPEIDVEDRLRYGNYTGVDTYGRQRAEQLRRQQGNQPVFDKSWEEQVRDDYYSHAKKRQE